ncbi:hypothetical protein RND81_03G087900 [Saponaria officinalis]|uniref:GDSL esterase/lipase n=1 Tax=Saponaria officinalis TaxID=3572 RepID=A0AAW1LZ24_SAPOF
MMMMMMMMTMMIMMMMMMMMMAPRTFLLFTIFLIISVMSLTQAHDIAPSSEDFSIDYLFQFGDSISDTGNLVIQNPINAHNFASFPYGITIHKTTGRCSDDLLMIDQFTRFFNKPFLNPYLDRQENFSQGVNFAVAGSTALDTATLQNIGVMSRVTTSFLNVQLDWFRTHLESICDTALDCQEKLRKHINQVRDMVPQVVDTIKNAAKQVIGYGATRIYISGNFPIGCLPIYKATFENDYTSDKLDCLDGLNDFARFRNAYIKKPIKELQKEYPEVAVVYGDYYSALSSVLKNAGPRGFDVPNKFKACYGSGDC